MTCIEKIVPNVINVVIALLDCALTMRRRPAVLRRVPVNLPCRIANIIFKETKQDDDQISQHAPMFTRMVRLRVEQALDRSGILEQEFRDPL